MRRVCYVSGTRADFGLVEQTLRLAQRSRAIDISVCATGMHLSPLFGSTIDDIEASGLRICGRVAVDLDRSTGESMAKAIGREIMGMTDVFLAERPDVVLVLGDRGEMLAGALAAIHLSIPVVHIHGGERSGTVDEPVRHAISKLAHYHFVATEESRERLVRMGERPDRVFVTGAPGLENLSQLAHRSREELCATLGFDSKQKIALVVFHPVLQESNDAERQMEHLMCAASAERLQMLCLEPNADAGAGGIRLVLDRYRAQRNVRIVTHLSRPDFISWMAAADIMVGNSSSGIIEAASFGLPVVNVGIRQQFRERNANVTDAPAHYEPIRSAIALALSRPRPQPGNAYGGDDVSGRIVELLVGLPLGPELLFKSNAY